MVNPFDSIRYTNVVSRRYRFHYKDMNKVLEDFLVDVDKLEPDIKGPLFYSMNNVPMDEVVHAEVFMPMQSAPKDWMEDMSFHSYFNIDSMISFCVHSNFEANTEVAYALLLDYMEHQQLHQVTPIFHVLSGDESLQYVFIKIGVALGEPEKAEA